MGSGKRLSVGVPGLDRIVSGFEAPYTLLIAGHPGAGKTTLATAMCYANAAEGRKCLYVSFYEDKGKYYKFMKRLGFDLEAVEGKGLYKFVNFPQVLDVEAIASEVSRLVAEGYEVVVVDSVTALLESIKESSEKRAWLLNYFYQLPAVVNGLLILIAELPHGEERLELGSVEFIVDGVILLKHRVEDGLLVRIIEVRKVRGAPQHVVETFFTIAEGVGVEVFAPPVLEELPPESGELVTCNALEEGMRIRRGFVISLFYPPEPGIGLNTFIWVLSLAVKGNAKVLVISYTTPAQVIHEVIKNTLTEYGIPSEKAEEILDKHMVITALNPFAYSTTQLIARELIAIEQVKPDIVIFHGVHLQRRRAYTYTAELKELFNEIMHLKSKGVTVFRVGTCLDEHMCNAEASLADIVFRFVRTPRGDGGMDTRIYIYERFKEPVVLPGSATSEFMKMWVREVKEHIEKP